MKKQQLKTPEGEQFIALSEQLRFELEAKIDMLWFNGQLRAYFEADFKLAVLNDECEIMINCLKAGTEANSSVALTICIAIKVWYGMYYDDRLSVLAKFDSIYKSYYKDNVKELTETHFKFAPFFIVEFSKTLSKRKWKPICSLGYD